MRNLVVSLTLVASLSLPLAAQQPADPNNTAPVPDTHGVYDLAPGVLQPMFVERAPVERPASSADATTHRPCVVRVIIAADGAQQSAEVIRSSGADFDNAVLGAIRRSRFAPGTVDGNPVPVRLFVTARVFGDGQPVLRILARSPETALLGQDHNYDVPPKALHTVEAEFSREARKKRIEGVVILSILVGVDGTPSDFKITQSVGYGLDENALAAVAQYRFQPATKSGVPVATRINVMISFHLGRDPFR